jgi:Skp family chaperone for outer membrane proteins
MSSLILAAVILIGAGRLWAENKDKKTTPPTRIALLNLTYVVKNYDKYKHFQDEIKHVMAGYQKQDEKLRAQLEKLRVQAEKNKDNSPIVPAKAEDLEEKAKKLQRELEDNQAKAKKVMGKRSDEEMKLLYHDVEQAAKRYAASHDIDLVLHYNDAVAPEDYMSTQNIARKLNTGALMPLYWTKNTDISKELVEILNQDAEKN